MHFGLNAAVTTMSIKIIPADASHLDALVPLVDAYRKFYRQESDIEATRSFMHERLENKNNDAFVFLAVNEQDQYVGFAQLFSCYSTVSLGKIFILNDLFVDPNSRKQGVGEALLKRSIDFGNEHSCKKLMLRTEVTNVTAQSVYERVGWIKDEKFFTYNFTY